MTSSNYQNFKEHYTWRRMLELPPTYPLLREALAERSLQWKVLVLDEGSKKIVDNVLKEDDILNENIASLCATTARQGIY